VELQEETGITEDMISIMEGVTIDEVSIKGTPSIRYLIAEFTGAPDFKLMFDPDELTQARWMHVQEALEILPPKRAVVLNRATVAINRAPFLG